MEVAMRKAVPGVVVVALLAGLLMALPSIGNTATRSVSVRDNSFSPRSLTARRGDTVRWRWAGRNPHNVVGRGFRSSVKRSGSYSRRFRSRGRFTIRCTIHPGMRQTITVR
jgi:plastocyanin